MFKVVRTNNYMILHNLKTGFEILDGINDHPDPFSLEFPSLLDIGIMGTCLNKCEFCYQGQDQKPNMKLEDFRWIIDQSKDQVMQVALGGRGDPNLHENFKEILEYCVKNKVTPNYTTSGKNLTEEQIKISKEYTGAIAVSMYNKNFTFRALEMFMDAGVKTNIHYVLTKDSFEDAISLLNGEDIWVRNVDLKKLNAIVFLLFKPQGRGKKLLHLVPTEDQIKELAEKIKKPECSFLVGLDSCAICSIAQVRELTENEQLFADTCEGARMSAYISPDMKFIPCSFGDHEKYGVDISKKDKELENIWSNSNIFINFRNDLKFNKTKCPLF